MLSARACDSAVLSAVYARILPVRSLPPGSVGYLPQRRVALALLDYPGEWLLDLPMLRQDLERRETPLWGYFCQISDSTTSYGSYSGAVPNEKITWGKLGAKTPKYIVESDATIVAPLIFSWVLGQ